MRSAAFLAALLLIGSVAARTPDAATLLRRVNRSGGRVLIARIPAFEQKRNFCVPTSVEMVLRYYGRKATQRELARALGSSRMSGTSLAGFEKKFGVGPLTGFACRNVYAVTNREVELMIRVYTEADGLGTSARRKFLKNVKGDVVFNAVEPRRAFKLTPQMRPELMAKLPEILKKHIDAGRPLLWCVAMNLNPDYRDDAFHMRVMCGYREEKGEITEITYLDPWTGKRRYKHVTFTEAVAMTTSLWLVTPESGADF